MSVAQPTLPTFKAGPHGATRSITACASGIAGLPFDRRLDGLEISAAPRNATAEPH